jgi:succinate dehydrogenase/fumarate reductase flavoprotein subunit
MSNSNTGGRASGNTGSRTPSGNAGERTCGGSAGGHTPGSKGPSAFTSSGKLRANRAAQFSPFANLRGYYDVVRKQERVVEPRREHTEEDITRISSVLSTLRKGDVVRVVHYKQEAYLTTCGAITEIVPEYQTLRIIKQTLHFEDIYEIEKL